MNPRRDAWKQVVTAYQTCTRRYAEMLGHFGLTIPQFDVLSAVSALQPEALPSTVAERLLVTRGNITGILKRLEAQGLLRRAAHTGDGRALVCQLTPQGAALLQRASAAAAAFIEAQLSPFDDPTVAMVGNTMRRMTQHLMAMDVTPLLGAAEIRPPPSGTLT